MDNLDHMLAMLGHEVPTQISLILNNTEELQVLLRSIAPDLHSNPAVAQMDALLSETGVAALDIESVSTASWLLDLSKEQALQGLRPLELIRYLSRVMPWIETASSRRGTGLRLSQQLRERSPTLLADRSFDRALLNLLDNASKYCAVGTAAIVSWHEDRTSGILTVEDIGIPLPRHMERERMYELGYRSSEARAKWVYGYGLGLAVARHVFEQHGCCLRSLCSELPIASRNVFALQSLVGLSAEVGHDGANRSGESIGATTDVKRLCATPTLSAHDVDTLSAWRRFALPQDGSRATISLEGSSWGVDSELLYEKYIAQPLYHVQFDVEVPRQMIDRG